MAKKGPTLIAVIFESSHLHIITFDEVDYFGENSVTYNVRVRARKKKEKKTGAGVGRKTAVRKQLGKRTESRKLLKDKQDIPPNVTRKQTRRR